MGLRSFKIGIVAILISVISWVVAPTADALTPVELTNVHAEDCPPEFAEGMVAPGTVDEARCYLIVGKAVNRSGKPVLNADIYGRIYDANDNPVMQNRTRLGAMDEVPPGESDFQIRISVSASQPPPLKLKQFKSSGFSGQVRR